MKTRIAFLALCTFALTFLQAQVKQDRNVGDFHSIEVEGAFKIYIRMGEKSAVTIIADEDVINNVKTTVTNGELEIEVDNDWWDRMNASTLEAYITVKRISEIHISGVCELVTKNTLKGDHLEIEASGASQINAQLSFTSIDLDLSGATEIILSGNSSKLNVDASGASEINAVDLQTKIVNIDASGACEAKVFATEQINVDASGACEVRYKGNPRINKDISGAASVSAM